MRRIRAERSGFTTASEVLGGAASGRRVSEGIRLYRLWSLWTEIAGKPLSSHARPLCWRGRDLIVRVEHPAWVQELSFLRQKLSERICELFPEAKLRSIKFEVGELPEPPKTAKETTPAKSRDLTGEELEFIEQAAGEIPDGEVREAARSAMRKGFGSKSS